MITRRESRSIALQTLFNFDFKKAENIDESYEYALSDFFDVKEENGKEVERIDKDEYSYNLIQGIFKKYEVLDEIIKKGAPEWPLEKISTVDRNILRIGIYELLFNEEKIPAPVAINESIILSKIFNVKEGSDKFIAGVLGTVLEASGIKEDESRKRIQREEKAKYGLMPYFEDKGKIKIALVFNIFNKWTLPKGSVVGKYPNEEEAVRDIAKRKLNIEGDLKENIGGHSYKAGVINDKMVTKTINYFLFEIKNPEEIKLDPKLDGLNEVRYFDIDELDKVDTYDDILPLFKKGKEIILSKK